MTTTIVTFFIHPIAVLSEPEIKVQMLSLDVPLDLVNQINVWKLRENVEFYNSFAAKIQIFKQIGISR